MWLADWKMEIEFASPLFKVLPSSFSNLVRACFHCTDGNPEVLEGEGMCPRLDRD